MGQDSPWLVCKECIRLFDADEAKVRTHCQSWWSSGQQQSPPGTGPVNFNDAIKAAAIGWEKAFGKRPSAIAEGVPLAVSLHASDRIGTQPAVVPLVVTRARKRNWWQFWK